PYLTAQSSRERRSEDHLDQSPNELSRVWQMTVESVADTKWFYFAPEANFAGGFLTGDYTTEPPSVTLSREKTKYSAWKFRDPERASRSELTYLENLND